MGKSMCRNLMKNGYKATIVGTRGVIYRSITVLPKSARNWLLKEPLSRILPRKWRKSQISCFRSSGRFYPIVSTIVSLMMCEKWFSEKTAFLLVFT